jgi:hypothetical protein
MAFTEYACVLIIFTSLFPVIAAPVYKVDAVPALMHVHAIPPYQTNLSAL